MTFISNVNGIDVQKRICTNRFSEIQKYDNFNIYLSNLNLFLTIAYVLHFDFWIRLIKTIVLHVFVPICKTYLKRHVSFCVPGELNATSRSRL